MLHNNGYDTQGNSEINPMYFATRLFRNIIAGINISFVSFVFLLIFVVRDPLISEIRQYSSDTIFSVSLFSIGAIIYSNVFSILFLFSRLIASFVSRFERIWSMSTPGIFVFIIFAQPIYAYFLHRSEGHSEFLFYLYIIISLAIFIPVLYIFPIFRGYNATFLVTSSIISRILHFPLYSNALREGPELFIVAHIVLTVLSLALFAAFQIRYKLYLSPGFERIFVPKKAFAIALILLSSIPAYFIFDPLEDIIHDHPVVEILIYFAISIFFVLIVQWILTAIILVFRSKKSEEALAILPSAILFGFIILSSIISVLSIASIKFNNQKAFSESFLYNSILDQVGSIFDKDGDRNSAFPGRDPDDRDPCIRQEHPFDYCEGLTNTYSMKVGERVISRSSHNFAAIMTIETTMTAKDIAKYMEAVRYSQNDVMYTVRKVSGVRTTYYKQNEILLPANQVDHALQAMFRGMNGIEEYAINPDSYPESILSVFSMHGYRTICILGDGELFRNPNLLEKRITEESIVESKSKPQIDSGCQIFEVNPILPDDGEIKSGDELVDFLTTVNRVYARYSASKNILWVHYKFSHESADPKGILSALDAFLKYGDVTILLMNPEAKLTAEMLHFSSDYERFQSDDLLIQEKESFLGEAALSAGFNVGAYPKGTKTEPMIGVLYNDKARSFYWPVIGLLKANHESKYNLPPITYRRSDGSVIIYDGIKGIVRMER